jgi:CheY-like chemotaxis protein
MAPPLKRQVLVVDDDRSVRDSVAMLLEAEGYNVTAAEDGFGLFCSCERPCRT